MLVNKKKRLSEPQSRKRKSNESRMTKCSHDFLVDSSINNCDQCLKIILKELKRILSHAIEEDKIQALLHLFSRQALKIFEDKVAEFCNELVNQSIKVSKRHNTNNVSSSHVEHANEYLVAGKSKRLFRHCGTLGGILLGAGLSSIVGMVSLETYSTVGVLLSTFLCVAGTFLITLHIGKG